jgi:hypothetical protein
MINIKAAVLTFKSFINNSVGSFKKEYHNQLKSISTFCGVNPVWDLVYNGDANINTLISMGYNVGDVIKDLSIIIKKYAPYIEEDMHSLRTNEYGNCLSDNTYFYMSDFCKALGTEVHITHHDIDMSIVVGYNTLDNIIKLFSNLIDYKLHSVFKECEPITGGINFVEHLNNFKLTNHTDDDINYRLFEKITYAAGCLCACENDL